MSAVTFAFDSRVLAELHQASFLDFLTQLEALWQAYSLSLNQLMLCCKPWADIE